MIGLNGELKILETWSGKTRNLTGAIEWNGKR